MIEIYISVIGFTIKFPVKGENCYLWGKRKKIGKIEMKKIEYEFSKKAD